MNKKTLILPIIFFALLVLTVASALADTTTIITPETAIVGETDLFCHIDVDGQEVSVDDINPYTIAWKSDATGATWDYLGTQALSASALSEYANHEVICAVGYTYTQGGQVIFIQIFDDSNSVPIEPDRTPSAQLTVPSQAYVDDNVELVCSATGGNQPLTIEIDAEGNGNFQDVTSTNGILNHVYTQTGNYNPECIVTDFDGDSAADDADIEIIEEEQPEEELTITSIDCFDNVVINEHQICSVNVEDNEGNPEEDVDVSLYYLGNGDFGSCVTDNHGNCNVERIMTELGTFTVYGTAEKQGFVPDDDTYPRAIFTVYEQASDYNIINLHTYNDSAYIFRDNEFYRYEGLYVSFQIIDLVTGEFIDEDIVTSSTLVGQNDQVDLYEVGYDDATNTYRYALDNIPLSDSFLGIGEVFAFAFNFTDGTGDMEQANIMILNNPPYIQPVIPDIEIPVNVGYSLDLNTYGHDIEDDYYNIDLIWYVSGVSGDYFTANVVGQTLYVYPAAEGSEYITLIVEDHNGDTAIQSVFVDITEEETLNEPPVIENIPDQAIMEGESFIEFDLDDYTEDPDNTDDELIFSYSGNADINVEIDSQTHVVTLTYHSGWTGSETITFRAEDPEGLYDTDEALFTVEEQIQDNVTADADGPYKGFVDEPLTFDASGSQNAVLYIWDFGDGSTAETTDMYINHTYGHKGDYDIGLTVIGEFGGTDTDTTTARIIERTNYKTEEENKPEDDIHLGEIELYGKNSKEDFVIEGSDYLILKVSVRNNGETDLEDLRVKIMIPYLGIENTGGSFDLDEDESATQKLITFIDVEPGEYWVKVTVSNGKVRESEYRFLIVE
ncbi:PKD domain-containing protein [Candidatus Woesearchaeota archaeon]|nr:PKD domain-containing protein [Candidatus Woesearchaeota archaeon]